MTLSPLPPSPASGLPAAASTCSSSSGDPARFAARRQRAWRSLRTLLDERGGAAWGAIDALVISDPVHVSYLTGFSGDSSYLVLTAERSLMVSDGRYVEQIARECPDLEAVIRPQGATTIGTLASVLEMLGVKSVGVEGRLTLENHHALMEAAPASMSFPMVAGIVEELRAVKEAEEIARIETAVALARAAFRVWLAGLNPDWDEVTAARRLEEALRDQGAIGSSFPIIVAAGAHAALPHARPRAGAVLSREEGESGLLLVDWGADLPPPSYKSDLTRMVRLSRLTDQFRAVYQVVHAAHAAAVAAIRPGVEGRMVDQAARAVIEAAGYGSAFLHAVGHGIGLEIHERPGLRAESRTLLMPGMVVTVEPGIYLPGWGGVRLEDDVLVTEEGSRLLCDSGLDPEPLTPPHLV